MRKIGTLRYMNPDGLAKARMHLIPANKRT
jgi:hypothetical protein